MRTHPFSILRGRAPWLALLVIALGAFAACDDGGRGEHDAPGGPPWFNDAGVPYCWNFDCPGDPEATTCGTCTQSGNDRECPVGFECSCELECLRGPRSYDGGVCDAGTTDRPDAMVSEWPACDRRHPPGT